MGTSKLCSRRSAVAVAASAICLGLSPAWADVVLTGQYGVDPNSPIGPGSTSLPGSSIYVSNFSGMPGALRVDGGSILELANLHFGLSPGDNGTGLVSDTNTRVNLLTDGNTNNRFDRLRIGASGTGMLTVNLGAVVDTTQNMAACLVPFHYCNTTVGDGAGSTGTLNIDGINTQVLIGQTFDVATARLAVASVDGYDLGIPGGTSRGTVNVTGGALLSTSFAQLAPQPYGPSFTGQESNVASVNINGAGSRWVVTGGPRVNHVNGVVTQDSAGITTSNHAKGLSTINITNGAVLEFQGPSAFAGLTTGGGRTDMLVTGAGSAVKYTDVAGAFQLGRRNGSARAVFENGGSMQGVNFVTVGRDGSFAELVIDGPASRFVINGIDNVFSPGEVFEGQLDVGRNGTGVVTVRNGAQLEILGQGSARNGVLLSLGRDAGSAGTLNIDGPGSLVRMGSLSALPGGGANESNNPLVRIGRDGSGFLNITNGGKLIVEGNAVSTVANTRITHFYIGGTSGTVNGGRGIATVSGAGSELRVAGSDALLWVGRGPQAYGQLTVANGAVVSSTIMGVGDAGATGVLRLNNAVLNLSGQETGDVLSGAFLTVGNGGGVGNVSIDNGSVLTIHNMGTSGAGMSLGGIGSRPLGDGSMTLSGGSQLLVQAAPGFGSIQVGRSGSGLLRVKGASTVDVGDGNFTVAKLYGSDGTVILSENSTANAGWVGVGRDKTASGSVDGGTGTFVLINSTLNAQQIVIGTNGFLGGTGTINGNVTNFGIFSPGNSPGTLEIKGSFVAESGSRMILEIAGDGAGGFMTDHVIFNGSEALDLTQLNAEFRFLGSTDPNAFQSSEKFNVDTFFQLRKTDGSLMDLSPAAFSGAMFSAKADSYQFTSFSFNATSGATLVAVAAVPEPETWAMLLIGLLTIGGVVRRRERVRS
jgi:T5SS/PEP-CTERM-associated repeat protein